MCSQNQRVRPGKFMRMPDFLLFAASACVQTAGGEIAVGSWAYKKSWRLMMQRKRASGVGGVTGRSSTTKSSARRAHMAPGLASKVQLRHLRRHQDQAQVLL